MMKTIFFGASTYVLPLIKYLQTRYELALVVTTETTSTDAIPQFCTENHIPFLSVTKLDQEAVKKIAAVRAPFAVLADFRLLIKQEVIDIFPKGICNIHPSLLPEYRGPTPGTTALLDGKTTTGVSLMLLDKELDHGPILGQLEEKIEQSDTSVSLYQRLFAKGVDLLDRYLPLYLEGKEEPKAQDHTQATYTKFLTRESGYIDNNKLQQKEKLQNMIRAYFPWPGVWTKLSLNGKEKIVKFLPNNLVQVEGKKPVSITDFLHGYPEAEKFLKKMGLLQ